MMALLKARCVHSWPADASMRYLLPGDLHGTVSHPPESDGLLPPEPGPGGHLRALR